MMWYSNGNGWVGWLVMSLMMLIFWGGLVALIAWAVRAPRSGGDEPTTSHESPLTILEARFARGEIDEDEFNRRRGALLQPSARP